jgi:hypothetical protein
MQAGSLLDDWNLRRNPVPVTAAAPPPVSIRVIPPGDGGGGGGGSPSMDIEDIFQRIDPYVSREPNGVLSFDTTAAHSAGIDPVSIHVGIVCSAFIGEVIEAIGDLAGDGLKDTGIGIAKKKLLPVILPFITHMPRNSPCGSNGNPAPCPSWVCNSTGPMTRAAVLAFFQQMQYVPVAPALMDPVEGELYGVPVFTSIDCDPDLYRQTAVLVGCGCDAWTYYTLSSYEPDPNSLKHPNLWPGNKKWWPVYMYWWHLQKCPRTEPVNSCCL